jgi:hypothetical protein
VTHMGDVSLSAKKTAKGVKFYPNRYHYAEKFHNFLDLKGIRITTVVKTLQGHGVSPETIKSFLTGRHIPNSWISHLIEDIYGIRFAHEDFAELVSRDRSPK